MNKTYIVLALGIITCGNAHGYEVGTHALMTQSAYQMSVLVTDPTVLTDMGFPGLDSAMQVYYDGLTLSTPLERSYRSIIESQLFNSEAAISSFDPYSAQGWMMRGAIREDDAPPDPLDNSPIPNELRVFNHFYDPINDIPLTLRGGLTPCAGGLLSGAVSCARNPDWALGVTNRKLNRFTILDAREAEFRALTGYDSQGNQLTPLYSSTLQMPADIRKGYWATMFRSLGDVTHLLQDLAQPQHTRNEPHSDRGIGPQFLQNAEKSWLTGHKSIIETYYEERALQHFYSDPNTNERIQRPSLVYAGYPIPTFSDYRSFYTTRDTDSAVMNRRGMADFSNREFFSAAKNINNTDYQFPPSDLAQYQTTPTTGGVKYFFAPMTDSLNPALSIASFPKASWGVWDEFLQVQGKPTYSLNVVNYDAMAGQLIPRATSYSAGLINYFFRGKIDMVADASNTGQYVIQNLGNENMSGTFSLYSDDSSGVRTLVPGATWNLTIAAGGQSGDLSFTPPDITNIPNIPNWPYVWYSFNGPSEPSTGHYILVFNGTMGQEQPTTTSVGAVTGKTIGASCDLHNDYYYGVGGGFSFGNSPIMGADSEAVGKLCVAIFNKWLNASVANGEVTIDSCDSISCILRETSPAGIAWYEIYTTGTIPAVPFSRPDTWF